jgi:preprotein translocase subunit SecD
MVAGVIGFSMAWPAGPVLQAAVRFEVRLAEDQPGPGLRAARVANSQRTVYLHPEAIVTNEDISGSTVVPGNRPSQFWIDVRLNASGANKMREATRNHLGKPVAMLIDGEVVTAPTLKSTISDAAVISGDYTQSEAQRIADGMRIAP